MTEDSPSPALRSNSVTATFNYLHVDADKVLSAFGKFGRYQMLTYLITTSVGMLFALNMMIMPFITKSSKFSCDLPVNNNRYSAMVGDSCHAFDSQLNFTVKCLSVNGAFYNYSDEKGGTITSDFDLVCEYDGMAEHATSIFLLGGMIVSPFISQLSDLVGRRPLFLVPLYVSVIANLACVFAPNYYLFLLFRFVSGVATASFSMTGSVLCLESVSVEFRSLTPVVSAISWVGGYMLAGVFSILFKDWRVLYFAASIPGILTIPFYWFTPESLHWLVTKKKDKKIQKYINASIAFNKQTISLIECKSDNETSSSKTRTFRDLFHPKIFVNLLINSYVLIVMSGTYWALSLYSTELSEDETTGYFLSGLVELPAGFLSAVFLVMFKRKTVSFYSLIFTAIFMICTVWIPMEGYWEMIFPLLAKVTNSIVWASQPLLYSESTPTTIRNVYSGVVGLLGEIGSVGAPYMNRLTAINKDAPSIVICLMSFIAACFVLLQPETKNKKLPEDIDDFDGGPLFRGCRTRKNKKALEKRDLEAAEAVMVKKPDEAVELLEETIDPERKEDAQEVKEKD
uniref:MFS domain-containing protein n=2 Tax=Caenorhabditis tropicalis TaxID=1561998 RepID=A0A1I7V2Z6_9PELO